MLFRTTSFSMDVDIVPPEILMLLGPSIFDEFGSGQSAEISIAGQESLFRKEVKLSEGQAVEPIKGINLEAGKVRDSDPLGDYYRLKAVWNLMPEDHYLNDPTIVKAVEEVKKIASGRKISLSGDVKRLCDMADNPKKEVIRIKTPEMNATLGGVELKNIRLTFVISTDADISKYENFGLEWFVSLEPVLNVLFNTNPPTADDVALQSKCSGNDGEDLYNVIQAVRSGVRRNGFLGNFRGVFEQATKGFGVDFYTAQPYSRPYLRLTIDGEGPLFGLDQKRNMVIVGYSRQQADHVCE
ncbi:hypothetical protein ACCS87_35685 [Rhizobium ruizarguesonis]|nr:hypothetical protein [Rhizobium leguminosarum bv. viciae]TCB62757.1 hypothetical protein E0J20_04800 [Rhizobium leguminosarum bv. viciae]